MSGLKKIRNESEREAYKLLKKKWPSDKIISQYKFDAPYKFRKSLGGEKIVVSNKSIIVDFVNTTKHIIIEIDDKRHQTPNGKRQDRARDNILSSKGYEIIRIKVKEQRLTVEINEDLHTKAKLKSYSQGKTLKEVIVMLLKRWLKK